MAYYKLVRDRIPEILKKKGINPINHTAKDEEEFEYMLLAKLREETNEFIEAPCLEEMADIMEVIYTILKQKNMDFADVERVRRKKAKERGGFRDRIIAFVRK